MFQILRPLLLLQTDPHWRDDLLFYEYFHGDNGAGIGASHQTGWTGLIARLIQMFGYMSSAAFIEGGRSAAILYRGKGKRRP